MGIPMFSRELFSDIVLDPAVSHRLCVPLEVEFKVLKRPVKQQVDTRFLSPSGPGGISSRSTLTSISLSIRQWLSETSSIFRPPHPSSDEPSKISSQPSCRSASVSTWVAAGSPVLQEDSIRAGANSEIGRASCRDRV